MNEKRMNRETQQKDNSVAQENVSVKDKKGKTWKVFAAAIVVLLVAVIGIGVGIGIYNTPENRMTRQLETAYKFLQEGDYEKAALAFEQVIAVDEKCIEAYAKGIEAYIKCGNEENLRDLFERVMDLLKDSDEEFLTGNREYVVSICLSVREVYGDDPEHVVKVLEQGLELTGGDERIKELLIDTYLEMAADNTEAGKYEDGLSIFDRLLALDGRNEKVLNGLADCLRPYLEELMGERKFDEIRVLAEKYSMAAGVDFEAILKRIGELTAPVEDQSPAVPESVTYTVSFESDGGNRVEAQIVESGDAMAKPDDPVKDGYAFAGWYEDEQNTKAWDFSQAVTADVTLYAKWTQNPVYQVTFEMNGGGSVSSQSVEAGSRALKPQNPVRTGYSFAGWYEDAQTTKAWDFSRAVTMDITIYAKWEELPVVTYRVNFETGADSTVAVQSVEAGGRVLRPQDPVRAGYNFAGWYADTQTTKVWDFMQVVTTDVTIYAKWEKQEAPKEYIMIAGRKIATDETELDLADCGISDISELSKMKNLVTLDLRDNNISNVSALSGLSKLEELDLFGNEIENLSGLSGLTRLRVLDLSSNRIRDVRGIDGLSNLEELGLFGNAITTLDGLQYLTKLDELDLGNNQIGNIDGLAKLTKLTMLNLGGNRIRDISALAGLTRLEELDLNNNQIQDIGVLSNLTGLTELDISANQISDISVLGRLTALTVLSSNENQIRDIGVLGRLTKLTNLSLNENQIEDIAVLCGLTNLRYLSLEENPAIDEQQLVEIRALLPKCTIECE